MKHQAYAIMVLGLYGVTAIAVIMLYALYKGFDGIMVASGTSVIGGVMGWIGRRIFSEGKKDG